jgi:hypothetical protein
MVPDDQRRVVFLFRNDAQDGLNAMVRGVGHGHVQVRVQRHRQRQQEMRKQGERHQHVFQRRDFSVQQKRRSMGSSGAVVAQVSVDIRPRVAPTTNGLATFPTAAPAVMLKKSVQIHKGIGVPFNVTGGERGHGTPGKYCERTEKRPKKKGPKKQNE